MPEGFKKAIAIGGSLLVGAVVGALLWATLQPPDPPPGLQPPDEERPPIIVENGSLDFTIEYPDVTNSSKGEWEPIGSSGRWRHTHDNKGPNVMKNSATNGTCVGSEWMSGDLTFTVGVRGGSDFKVDVRVTGNAVVVEPGDQLVEKDPTDASHLVVGPEDTWIKEVASRQQPTAKCTFQATDNARIRIEQKH